MATSQEQEAGRGARRKSPKPKGNQASPPKTAEAEPSITAKRMRPAQDVLARIEWDSDTWNSNDVIIGYLDRHDGVIEIDFDIVAFKRDSTEEEFIPLHRIRYFRLKSTGKTLWDREARIDRVFNSV